MENEQAKEMYEEGMKMITKLFLELMDVIDSDKTQWDIVTRNKRTKIYHRVKMSMEIVDSSDVNDIEDGMNKDSQILKMLRPEAIVTMKKRGEIRGEIK